MATDRASFAPRVFALELDVPDVERAVRFYRDAFGLEESRALSTSRLGVLECDGGAVVLRPTEARETPRGAPAWSLNLRVSDLDSALVRARGAGAKVEDATPRRIPIGRAISVADPFGHAVHLIDVDGDAPERACDVYNFGASAADVAAVERDFARLGFEVDSREFLPGALPLAKAGRTPVVLHGGATASADAGARGARLVLAVESLEPALAELEALGMRAPKAPFASGSLGRGVVLRTETGLALRVLERSQEQLAFERLRGLAGEWDGTSDHGWSSKIRIEVIAGGSAVLETTAFEAHPGETMLTLFHKDGPRLFLTHYCVAGNQPRLCARRFDDGGDTVTFEYFDGTNLASRDQGHMDRAVIRIAGPDAFSSTWNWYQDGKEGWKEAIEYRRASRGESTPRER